MKLKQRKIEIIDKLEFRISNENLNSVYDKINILFSVKEIDIKLVSELNK